MQGMVRRWLAALLALVLLTALAAPVMAEDWRDMLRGAFGLGSVQEEADEPLIEDDGDGMAMYSEPITDAQGIVNYLDAHNGELPPNFITKKTARQMGWDSSYNYVGDVAPNCSIGGDRFGNYEGQLPDKKGRTWYECDVDYKGKKRGAKRLLFSSDGLYYYTSDHYKTFTQMFPED